MSHNLLIKNALIFDGHSPDLREGSILIRNGEIEALDAKSASGVEVFDA
ncbi:MAG: hypothetical protein F2804_06670, partial [Actinobacteria bacterium]|nr:hypothetical protein [Actinomycetota bacterium]